MRLAILDRGHKLRHKLLFRIIKLASGHPAPDVVKLLMYRPEYFGRPMGAVFQETMRGSSEWAIGDRELMASYISKTNECEF
jgi:hypothetical protein